MIEHAKLSPSAASGWMICADYPNAQEPYPNDSSSFADEGTFAHFVSDMALAFGTLTAYDLIGLKMKINGVTYEWEEYDAELLQPGLDWVREQRGTFYGEHRVDLSDWLGPNQFGTMDRCVVDDSLMVVSDLKWGRGVPVSPVKNKQQMLYALGAWKKFASHITDPTYPILIDIDQPRCPGGGGQWRTTLRELLEFGEEARAAAERTRQPNPPRVASKDGCLWCKAKHECPTFDAFNLEMLAAEFDDLDDGEIALPDIDGLTPERRAVVLNHAPMIRKWLDSIHARTLADALAGNPTGGLKAVAGRKSPDKWGDADSAEALLIPLLGEKSFTKKLITPTQASKKVSLEDMKPIRAFIVTGERKPSLVPEDDDRPAITLADEFDDLV